MPDTPTPPPITGKLDQLLVSAGLLDQQQYTRLLAELSQQRGQGGAASSLAQLAIQQRLVASEPFIQLAQSQGMALLMCGACSVAYIEASSLLQHHPLIACPGCNAPLNSPEGWGVEAITRILASSPLRSLKEARATTSGNQTDGLTDTPALPPWAVSAAQPAPPPLHATPAPPPLHATPVPPPLHAAPAPPPPQATPSLDPQPLEITPALDQTAITQTDHDTQTTEPVGKQTDRPCAGDYAILEELGRGGMGAVYRVEHLPSGRPYALKVLLPTGDPQSMSSRRERFLREVKAACSLSHECVVKVHSTGSQGGLDYFVMDVVDGKTLEAALADSSVDRKGLLKLMEPITRGIHHAHDQGVIHRDLKPGNIIIDENGRPHILDFGLALIQGEERLTRTGSTMGTPFYMAPEQIRAKIDLLDHRADIFALGIIIYEILVGEPPFVGSTPAEVYMNIVNDPPVPPSKRLAKMDHDLETICLRALEKDPRDRYQTAEALADDLASYHSGTSIETRRVGLAQRLRRQIQSKPLVSAALALTALVMGILLALAIRGPVAEESSSVLKLQAEASRLRQQLANLKTSPQQAEAQRRDLETQLRQVEGQLSGEATPSVNPPPSSELDRQRLARWISRPDQDPEKVLALADSLLAAAPANTPWIDQVSTLRNQEQRAASLVSAVRDAALESLANGDPLIEMLANLDSLPRDLASDDPRWSARIETLRLDLEGRALAKATKLEAEARTAHAAGDLAVASSALIRLRSLGVKPYSTQASQALAEINQLLQAEKRRTEQRRQKELRSLAKAIEETRTKLAPVLDQVRSLCRTEMMALAAEAIDEIELSDLPAPVAGEAELLRHDVNRASQFERTCLARLESLLGQKIELRSRTNEDVRYDGLLTAVQADHLILRRTAGEQNLPISRIDPRDLAALVPTPPPDIENPMETTLNAGVYLLLSGRQEAAAIQIEAARAAGANVTRYLSILASARQQRLEAIAKSRLATLAEQLRSTNKDRALASIPELRRELAGSSHLKQLAPALATLESLASHSDRFGLGLSPQGEASISWTLSVSEALTTLRMAPRADTDQPWGADVGRAWLTASNITLSLPTKHSLPLSLTVEFHPRPATRKHATLELRNGGARAAITITGNRKASLFLTNDAGTAISDTIPIELPNRPVMLELAQEADGTCLVRLDTHDVLEATLDKKLITKTLAVSVIGAPLKLRQITITGISDPQGVAASAAAAIALEDQLRDASRRKRMRFQRGAWGKTTENVRFSGNSLLKARQGTIQLRSAKTWKQLLLAFSLSRCESIHPALVLVEPTGGDDDPSVSHVTHLPTWPNEKREVLAFQHKGVVTVLVGSFIIDQFAVKKSALQIGLDSDVGAMKLDNITIHQ